MYIRIFVDKIQNNKQRFRVKRTSSRTQNGKYVNSTLNADVSDMDVICMYIWTLPRGGEVYILRVRVVNVA